MRVQFMSSYAGDDAALHDEAQAGVKLATEPFTARTLANRARETPERVFAGS
jgi:hypothetical protein